MQSLNALLPYLGWLAGAGSGLVASWLFDQIRDNAAMPERLYLFLHTAAYARYISMALSVLIALAAVSAAALIEGRPVLAAVDTTLAAIIAAQVRHAALYLPNTPPTIEYTYEHEPE